MTDDRWIVVPHWERFQHYGMARRPIWIKNYMALLHKDEYLDLGLGQRGLLHGIWLAYGDSQGRLRRRDLNQTLHIRARNAHIDSLQEAGLIGFAASRPSLLSLEVQEIDARAREGGRIQDTAANKRKRQAERWIRNGAAAEVPASSLAAVIEDEFKIHDAQLVQELVAQAQEFRP